MSDKPLYIDEPGSLLQRVELACVPVKDDFVRYQGNDDLWTTRKVMWRQIEPERIVLRVSEKKYG
jgi:hypothetical protein